MGGDCRRGLGLPAAGWSVESAMMPLHQETWPSAKAGPHISIPCPAHMSQIKDP